MLAPFHVIGFPSNFCPYCAFCSIGSTAAPLNSRTRRSNLVMDQYICDCLMACALLAPVMMSWSIFKMNWTYIFMDYFADFSFRQKKCFRLSFSWSKSVISINIFVCICQISIEEQISKMDSPWNISSFAERQSLLTCLMLQVHFFQMRLY